MYMCGSNWWLITLILQTKIFKNGRKLLKEWFTWIFNAYTCVVTLDKFLKNIYIVSLRSLKIGYKHLLGVHLRWTVVPSRGSRWLIRLLPLKLGMSTGPICMCFHCSEMYVTNSAHINDNYNKANYSMIIGNINFFKQKKQTKFVLVDFLLPVAISEVRFS